MNKIWTHTLTSEHDSLRADRAIAEAWQNSLCLWELQGEEKAPSNRPVLTRSRIQQLIEDGKISVNSHQISASQKLKADDVIALHLKDPSLVSTDPESLSEIETQKKTALQSVSIPMLYEDDHLLIVNKPQGITVHPSDSKPEGALTQILHAQGVTLAQAGSPNRPGVVHRIDQYTTGILVLAKTDECYYGLQKLFSTHSIEREYIALVYGHFEKALKSQVRVHTQIARNPNLRTRMAIVKTGGKEAITFLNTLEILDGTSLVKAKLETGRTHQVRVHLTSLGHSIIGDPTYGAPSAQDTKLKKLPIPTRKLISELPGQMLHAQKLAFNHPITGAFLSFSVEPWPQFQNLYETLKLSR